MFAISMKRMARPVGVLLGGSGLARMLDVRQPVAAALLRPNPAASGQDGSVVHGCASAG